MDASATKPVRVTGVSALRRGLDFARDPLAATRRAFEAFGPFVILDQAVPLIRLKRTLMLGVPLVLTAGASFNAEVLSDSETWRGVSVLPGGPKNSAARRMTAGLPRLTGSRHAHYRKLIAPPLRRSSVEALYGNIARIAEAEIASWPLGEPVDLWDRIRLLMQRLSIELLFGADGAQCGPIAELSGSMMERKWGPGAFALPLNVPFTSYGRIVRDSENLERRILQWVRGKRGRADPHDLAAIVVNGPDQDGKPPDDATIVAHIASLFALSSEGSQSALMWTLILLAQHSQLAAALGDELNNKIGGVSAALDKAGELSYLDAVVRESMRILPPVPLQIRVAQCNTTIAGHQLPQRTRLMLNTYLTNRMGVFEPDGDVFQPERWSTLTPNAFEYPVFSAGPHLCPGYWFGTAAVKIALAAILTRLRVELPAATRIDYRAQPTLRPRQRVNVVLRPADGRTPAPVPITGTIRDLVKLPT